MDPEHHVWICARPPGRLVLGHYGGAEAHAALSREIGGRPTEIAGETDPNLSLALILDEHELRQIHDRQDVDAITRRSLDVFERYFRLSS
jgi:hypothetical protein